MSSSPFESIRIVVRGGGDLGSGVAWRLRNCGFPVLILELPHPLLVRRAVSFGSAILEGRITVEGVTARRVEDVEEALSLQAAGTIPVLADPEGHRLAAYAPTVLVDARMLKREPGLQPGNAAMVIGLGPGFVAPDNCTAVVETQRGHHLGRVIRQGSAQPDTGLPEEVLGYGSSRVLRASTDGALRSLRSIGDQVLGGQMVALVGETPVMAPFDGVVRGLVHDGLLVRAGMKIGDVDPRGQPENSFTISDKALAIGGGVLEAILSTPAVRALL